MSWRYRFILLHTTPKTLSLRHFSSTQTVRFTPSFPQDNFKLTLTPQIVHSTLLSCRSDLIALSFFIWCAKQHNYFHDAQTFDFMIGVVTRLTNRHKSVKAIIKELDSVGLTIKAQTFLLLLRIYWRGGMYSMVFETCMQMSTFGFKPNTFARNVLMDVFFKLGRVDAGINVLKETEFPNFLSFNIALTNLCKLNDLVNLKNVLQMMLGKGYYPNVETFEMVLNCFCKVGRLVEAYQLFGLMITLGISLSANSWSMLINGFCRLHRPDVVSCLLDKMLLSGCSPNIVTYTTLFKGFMQSRMISSAFGILDTMESKGYEPDLLLCNVLIDCFSKIGRYDDALHLFMGMPKWNLVPDSYTLSSLLLTICLSRRFYLFPDLVGKICIETDIVVCNSLLHYFCEAGFPDLAVEFYDEMLDEGIVPDKYSFVGLLRGLCGAKRLDDAVNVYLGIVMNYDGLDAHVHTVIMSGLIRNGKYHRAVNLFWEAIAQKYQLDAVSYTVAIHGLLKSGRAVEASALYNQMKESGLSPNAHTYNIMLHGFCAKKDTKMVKSLLQDAAKAGAQLDCNAFLRLVKFLVKSHRSSLFFNHLIRLLNLDMVPDKAMNDAYVIFDGLSRDVKFSNAYYSLPKSNLEDNKFPDPASSDDLPSVVATSMG